MCLDIIGRSVGHLVGSDSNECNCLCVFFFFLLFHLLSLFRQTDNKQLTISWYICMSYNPNEQCLLNIQFVNILKAAMLSSGSCLNSSDDESKECFSSTSSVIHVIRFQWNWQIETWVFQCKVYSLCRRPLNSFNGNHCRCPLIANWELNEYQNGIAEFHGLISNIFDWFYWIITE